MRRGSSRRNGRPLRARDRGGRAAPSPCVNKSVAALRSMSSSQPAHCRETFVDAEEAAMKRAIAKLTGEDPARKAGNKYSQTNRVRVQQRLAEDAEKGIVPLRPDEAERLRKQLTSKYTTISQRAVPVPRVGGRARPVMPPPIAFVPHRRTRGEIREEHNNFERDRPPAYVPTKSSDERKAELALRNEFHGKTPQEVAAAQAGPPKPRQPRAVATMQQLRNQIVDEVAERQEFLDSMAKMGKGTEYEAKIRGEIAERLADLKKLDQLEASDAEQSAQS